MAKSFDFLLLSYATDAIPVLVKRSLHKNLRTSFSQLSFHRGPATIECLNTVTKSLSLKF